MGCNILISDALAALVKEDAPWPVEEEKATDPDKMAAASSDTSGTFRPTEKFHIYKNIANLAKSYIKDAERYSGTEEDSFE